MAYAYADWAQQPQPADRYARLNLHIGEVSAQMGVDYASDGTSANRGALTQYLTLLMAERARLEKLPGVGASAGDTLPGGVALGDLRT